MKITEKSLCFTISSYGYRKHHYDSITRYLSNTTDEHQRWVYELKRQFYNINTNEFRVLVLSEKTKRNLENYVVPKKIEVEVLRTLPNRFDIIQVDDKSVFKYIKTEMGVTVSYDSYNEQGTLDTYWFMINLETGHVHMDSFDSKTNKSVIDYDKMVKTYYGTFLILVTYLELTDVTLNIVKPNVKKGDIFKGNFINNSSNLNVIHVNTNWNTLKIVIGEFGVRSHMRLQRVGKGLCEFKWVFVNSYKKNLVIRTPQKDLQRG